MQPTSIFSRSLKYNPRVSSRLIIRVGIIILVFLTPQSIITVNSVSNINSNVSSILVSEVDGGLIHIQVSNTNSQVIWKRNNPLSDYDNLYVDDLNLDGEYEIIAELSNVALELIDFKTGELIWSHNLENTFSTSRDIVTGDLDGDSVKEIIVTNRIEKEFEDKAISVYNSITGDVISRIQTPSNSSSYGSDNVAVHDLNNDGTNEIILSFGAALWDYDNNQGQYLLQVLTYNKENSNFTTIWERTGSDIGGNTRMKVIEYSDETLIVTSGWYDNPIRAWNSEGDLLWENRLVNTTEKIILAENGLEIVKINNEVHLFAMQKNYWDNYTLSLFNINPLTGNYYDPPIQINEVSSISGNAGKEGIYLNIKHWMHDNNQIYTEEMLHYYNYTSKKLENMVHDRQKWKNVMVSDTINSYINIKDKFEGILAVDDSGIIWLSTLNRNYPIYDSVNAGIRDVYVMNNIDEHLEGTIQYRYNVNESRNIPFIVYSLVAIILLIISYVAFRNQIHEKRYDKKFTSEWKLRIYTALHKIFKGEILQNSYIVHKEPSTTYLESIEVVQDVSKIEIDKPGLPVFKEFLITDKFSLLKQWKTHLSQLGTKIKVGDIALLIEIMRYYPESVTKQEIIKNIAFSPKSTLYRRLSILEKLELAIDTNQISIDEDFRYKNLKISQLGIDFLKSLYSALKQEIG